MDNVLNKILCILSCAILIISIFISSFFLTPVFADTIEFPSVPNFVATSGQQVFDNGIVPISPRLDSSNYQVAYTASTDNVYIFAYSGNSSSIVQFCIISEDSFTLYRADNENGYWFGSATITQSNSFNSDYTSITYWLNFNSSSQTLSVPFFNTQEEGVSAFTEFLTSQNTFEPLYNNFNIPRGYLAWIEWNFIPDSLELSTTFPNNSDFWNSSYPFNTQWFEYYHGSSVITIPTVLSNGGTQIPWVKGGNTNIWGQSKEASAGLTSITGSVDSPSFICNPVYQSGSNRLSSLFNSNELPPMNGSITIHDPDGSIKKIRLYSLTAAYNSETDSIDNTLSYDSPSYSVDVDENGVVSYQPLNSSAPAVFSPVENGGTYVDSTEYSTSDIINTINNAFSTLISRIEAIFHPAAGYFNSLLNSFNDFVHWLSNLWVWLPAPIVTLIEAVLYISISVGLIKLVLK